MKWTSLRGWAGVALLVVYAAILNFLVLRSPKTTHGDRTVLWIADGVIALLIFERVRRRPGAPKP